MAGEQAGNLGFLTPERKKFVEMLGQRKIPFLIVGGEALRAAGLHRLTKDLDIVVPRERRVIEGIKKVASFFGYQVPRGTESLLTSEKFTAMYVRLAPRRNDSRDVTHHVDVLFADAYLPDFDAALSRGIEIPVGSGIRYASVDELLRMKKQAVGRPGRSPQSVLKDRGDIAFLSDLRDGLRREAALARAGRTRGKKNKR